MAEPNPGWYTTGDIAVPNNEHDFGSCEAGAYSTGKIFRLYNNKGSTASDTMTSVKISIRDDDGGTDEIWVQQHWVQIKSDGCSSSGIEDDAQGVYTAVGKNKELSVGDIPSNKYRTIHTRCYPPTDAEEDASIEFQLRTTYQQPATSICNWITGLRGDGVVASTGDPFAMSTGGTTGTIPYEAGYALIYNNEIYYGSSGSYNCSTASASTGYKIYLNESGAFGMTTGDVDVNQLLLYDATISSGVCTALTDKRAYLSGLQSGTTGAMSTTPDLGDLYLDITNGKLYAAKTAGNWTVIVPGATFVALTDTPANYTGDASKILTVTTGEGAVEFTSSTGIALDSFGTPSTGTSLNATTGRHGLLPILSGSSGEYLDGDGNFAVPKASDVEISEISTATYDDMQDFIDNTQSGGRISGGNIGDDSSGGITISSGTGFIQTTTGDIGLTQSFDWAADAIVSTGMSDDSANYVYIDYSTGVPVIKVTAARGDIHLGDHFTLGRVYKSSGDLHILQSGVNLYNTVRREHERLVAVRGFERASGGVISESAVTERAIESTIGNFYLGANEITTTGQDTSTGGSHYFTTHYRSDATWTATTGQQQISNSQYNASTGLADLTGVHYGVHWAYIHFESDIHVVYGRGDYTLAQAESAVVPDSLPSMVEDFGILVSKIIIQKDSSNFKSIVTAYKVLFPVTNPAEHNDLGALDTADYQHLTQAEHDEITEWAGAVTLSTGGAINLVTFSTGGTINIPSGQEYQINGSEVKLDEWATPTTGTTLNSSTGRHGLLIALDGTTGNYLRGDGSWQTPPGATGGEANTASNAGTTGIGIYYQKTGVDLEFKAIHSTGNISVTDSTGTHTINLDVISTGIKLDDFGAPDDNTDLDASTGTHGLLLKRTGSTVTYLRADGTWATPTGTTGGAAMTFLDLTDTPSDYTDDASKILVVTTGEDAVEFTSSTGIALDAFGTPTDITTNNATTGHHGLLLKLTGSTSTYLNADGAWTTPPDTGEVNTASNAGTTGIGVYYQKSTYDLQFKAIHSTGNILITDSTGTHTVNLDVDSTGIALDSLGTPSTGTTLDSSTGRHGLLPILGGNAATWLDGTGVFSAPTASEVGALESSGAFTARRLAEISTTGGVIKESPFAVTTGDVLDFGAHSAGFTEQTIATTTGTAAIDWSNGIKALFTRSTGANGTVTFSFTAPPKSVNLQLTIRGSTAGSTGTVTWPTVYWQGGAVPTLTSGVSAIDVVSFSYSTGLTAYLGLGSANFSTG